MNQVELPDDFSPPDDDKSCSVLVSSYNTKPQYVRECLNSIKNQVGKFNMKSYGLMMAHLPNILMKSILKQFKETSRWISVVYDENDGNKGIGYSLNKGVNMCSHEIIIKMDSDDIMVPNRIAKQLNHMYANPECMICGGQVSMFKGDNVKNVTTIQNIILLIGTNTNKHQKIGLLIILLYVTVNLQFYLLEITTRPNIL